MTLYLLGTNGLGIARDRYDRLRTVARVPDANGNDRRLSRALVKTVSFVEADDSTGWALSLTSAPGDATLRRLWRNADVERTTTLRGAEAARLASVILAHVNRAGGGSDDVRLAVERLEGGAEFSALARGAARLRGDNRGVLPAHALPPSTRIALEMSLHEDDERRWLDGELHELEQRWREAEVIAGIADGLTLPAGIDERISAERRKRAERKRTAAARAPATT